MRFHKAVEIFVRGITIIPIISAIKEYAEIKTALRKNGTPMHDEFDLIIGVTALANELTLVTDNLKDFQHIKNLKTENWFQRF